MSLQALPYILLLGFLYGSTLIASRFGVGQFHPLTYIGLRMTLASAACALIYIVDHRRRPLPSDRQLWRNALILSVFGTAIPMVAIVSSLQFLSSGLVSVLLTMGPAITVVMAHFTLSDERLSMRKSIGVLLALSGGVLLAIRGETGLSDGGQSPFLGYGLILITMIFGSASTIFARKHMRDMNSFDVASIRIFIAMLIILPLAYLIDGINLENVTREGYFALGYAALTGTFLAILISFYVVKRFGATASAMTQYVIPVVASIGGVLLLGETISAGMLVGMALIAAGLAFINQRNRGQPKPL